jgi:2-methylisoborneol synthase
MNNMANTLDLMKSVLSSGPKGLGTKTTGIAAIMNRQDQESDTELRGRPPFRNDEPLGEEINEMLMKWSASIGLYEGHLDYLRKCNFGRYVMLSHPFSYDRERLFLAGQSMVALFALDDYFVDDHRSGATLDMVGRNLSLCMSALDEPFLNTRYENDTQRFLKENPIFISLQQYIENTARLGTPQQVARVRHEDMSLFVSMCHEATWRIHKHIAPVWEYLGCRQPNGFTPCLALIDVVDGYELPHNIYSLPDVRRVVKIAGLVTVMVNDLVSKDKELEAGVYQFGIREAIQKEEGCSYEEAHRLGVRFHNELMRIFEEESAKLMVYATPELRMFLIGLEAWIAGSREWHLTSKRYSGD